MANHGLVLEVSISQHKTLKSVHFSMLNFYVGFHIQFRNDQGLDNLYDFK